MDWTLYKVTKKRGVVFCIFFFASSILLGQTNANFFTVSGKVTDDNQESLIGVNIIVKSGNFLKGCVTNNEGDYILEGLPSGKNILQVSYIGYQSKEIELELSTKNYFSQDIILKLEAIKINDVQVEGKSKATRIQEQAYEVAAIDAIGFENSISDTKAILNRVSGIRILEESGLGSETTFTLNGFSGNQIKFFMDGIPMDNFSSSISLGDIPVNLIERIEVYKGVVPVWLGTDALGGAVNIITKKRNRFLDVSYSYGSFNTHRVSVNTAYTNKSGFVVRANAYYNYSDNNYKVRANVVNSETKRSYEADVERFHDRYWSGALKVEAGITNKRYADDLLVGIMGSANDKQVQNGVTMATVFGGIVTNSKSLISTLKYKKSNLLINGLDLNFSAAYNLSESQSIDTLSGVTYNWLGNYTITYDSDGNRSSDGEYERQFTTKNDDELISQLNLGYKLSAQSSFAFNYAFNYFHRHQFDKEDPENISNQFPKSLNKNVLGLSYKIDFSDQWSTTVFGKFFFLNAISVKQYDFALQTQRTESYQSFTSRFGYGFATSYNLSSNIHLKASFEHTNRLPDPDEIFGDALFVEANPELGPEQSENVNLGFNYKLSVSDFHRFTFGTSFIFRNVHDMIYEVVSYGSPVTNYDNLGKVRTLGGEGTVKYSWKNLVNIDLNITYQNITDRAEKVYNESYTSTGWENNNAYGYRLPNTPYFFGNLKAGIKHDNLLFSKSKFQANYFLNFCERYFLTWVEFGSDNSDYVIPRQFSHDFEITYSFNKGKYNFSGECRNILNTKLYDKYYLQKPGRAFYIKLRYTI